MTSRQLPEALSQRMLFRVSPLVCWEVLLAEAWLNCCSLSPSLRLLGQTAPTATGTLQTAAPSHCRYSTSVNSSFNAESSCHQEAVPALFIKPSCITFRTD